MPEPQHIVVPLSYHNEPEVESKHMEKVLHANKPVVRTIEAPEPLELAGASKEVHLNPIS